MLMLLFYFDQNKKCYLLFTHINFIDGSHKRFRIEGDLGPGIFRVHLVFKF